MMNYLLRFSSVMAALMAVLASTVSAQDPGETKPCLEALVANSSEVMIVRVKSFQLDEAGESLDSVEFERVEQLKRPWHLPGYDSYKSASPLEKPADPAPAAPLVFDSNALPTFRYYDQSYWSEDLSSSYPRIPGLIPFWHEEQTLLMLFTDFQSVNSGQLQFVVDLEKDTVFRSDWSALTSKDVIAGKTAELIENYRGVEKVKLVLLDVFHFDNAAQKLATANGGTFSIPTARVMLVPFDSQYEKLLLEQMRDPKLLHDNKHTTDRAYWLVFTKAIYHFDNDANRKLIGELLQDPEIGEKQKDLLQKIQNAWTGE